MTDRIEPALTPDSWAAIRSGADSIESYYYLGDKGAVIAACNDELPDTDPRKITREIVNALRALYEMGCSCGVITPADGTRWDAAQSRVPRFLDALESYLPPE